MALSDATAGNLAPTQTGRALRARTELRLRNAFRVASGSPLLLKDPANNPVRTIR